MTPFTTTFATTAALTAVVAVSIHNGDHRESVHSTEKRAGQHHAQSRRAPATRLYCRFIDSDIDAGVNLLSGKSAAHRAVINPSKTYSVVRDVVFDPKVFAELKNSQAIVLAYEELNPLPPTYCYLKPHYRNPNRTWIEQVTKGEI